MCFGTDGRSPGAGRGRRRARLRRDPRRGARRRRGRRADRGAGRPGQRPPADRHRPGPRAGLGLSVTAATFSDQRASFAGRGTQISLAAYGAFERGKGPRGLLGAFPDAVTTFERGEVGPPRQPPCGCRDRASGATPATPTCRARRWRRRSSRRRGARARAQPRPVVRRGRAPAQGDARAGPPAPDGRPSSAGGSSTRAPRSPPRASSTAARPRRGSPARAARAAAWSRCAWAGATTPRPASSPPASTATSSGARPTAGRAVRIATTRRSRYRVRTRRGGRYAFFTRRRRPRRQPRAVPPAQTSPSRRRT